MPVRLCRYCSRICTEGRWHAECNRAYQRAKSRRHRERKGTTSQRGYDAVHQALRKVAIARHPYCADCGTTEDLCADHIVPTSKGGKNALSNYQVRCRSCNTARMTSEKKSGRL